MIKTTQIYKIGDCLALLPEIPDNSIDMILCDLPYHITQCDWDVVIPFEPLWEQYKRIIKDNGAIVLTASQPFTSALVMSNHGIFKYDITWDKQLSTGFLNANKMPLRSHEDILIFYSKQPTYNPQKIKGKRNHSRGRMRTEAQNVYGKYKNVDNTASEGDMKHPVSIVSFRKVHASKTIHPNQKPIPLAEYLIRTYTNEGDMVHDSCIGSGWSLQACRNLNRNYIGFEISDEWEEYYGEQYTPEMWEQWGIKV